MPSNSGDHLQLPAELLTAVMERHQLRASGTQAEPLRGSTSTVYRLADAVLKVPHHVPAAVAALRTDATVSPIARAAGVRTPRLIALDDSLTLLPVPYAIYERVPAPSLETLAASPEHAGHAWRELGRDLALVHGGGPVGPLAGLRSFDQTADVDPRPWLDDLASAGRVQPETAGWLAGVLDRLAPAALAPVPRRLCHGDVNAANVLVAPRTLTYRAVVDWAGAGWLDPAWDFAAVSLRAVPYVLAGHRQVAPLPSDETVEARVLWCYLQTMLYRLHGTMSTAPPPGGLSERVLADVRLFLARTGLG
jgi:aminoglycoside phosphotransferase (APT) family kinase protein